MISKQFWYLICVTKICNPVLWTFLYKFWCFYNARDDFEIVSKHLIWFRWFIYIFLKTTIWIITHEKVEKYLLYDLQSRPERLSSTFLSYRIWSDLADFFIRLGMGGGWTCTRCTPLRKRLQSDTRFRLLHLLYNFDSTHRKTIIHSLFIFYLKLVTEMSSLFTDKYTNLLAIQWTQHFS